MTQLNVLDATGSDRSGYKVDVNRGERIGRVSSEWFSRPADERYLSLSELHDAVHSRAERSRSRTAESAIRVEASRDDAERLALMLPGGEVPLVPTHWSFGQLTTMIGAPSMYLRQLPAPLAAINLQYGLTSHRAELIKTLEVEEGRVELRAVTGPDYGRIYDHELVAAVQRIAGNGTGDTRWKVPGVLDWATGNYNPRVDITKCTTTLYASDRDVFLFLVDDLNPIEAGKLPDGSPDLYFRGFYCWNSEVGAKTLGIASFYLRAVCQNRNLWGVEDFEEITIRHSKYAASRFAHEAAPALTPWRTLLPCPSSMASRRRASALSRAPTTSEPNSCASGGSANRRLQKSSRGCFARKAASPRASSISCRGSPRSRATTPSGCPARSRGAGEEAARPGSLTRGRPSGASFCAPDFVLVFLRVGSSAPPSRGRGRRFAS
jgi:hypothetical protein